MWNVLTAFLLYMKYIFLCMSHYLDTEHIRSLIRVQSDPEYRSHFSGIVLLPLPTPLICLETWQYSFIAALCAVQQETVSVVFSTVFGMPSYWEGKCFLRILLNNFFPSSVKLSDSLWAVPSTHISSFQADCYIAFKVLQAKIAPEFDLNNSSSFVQVGWRHVSEACPHAMLVLI